MVLLTVKEASQTYKISASKLRELCVAGSIKAAKIGVGWRIDAESLEGYISHLFDGKTSVQAENYAYKRPKKQSRKGFDFKAELKRLRGQ